MIPGASGVAESAATATLIAVTRLRDPDLADHGLRTAHIAAAIAAEMGLDDHACDRVYLGALLHDIGKLGVPEAVLWKPAGLDRAEWGEIRTHPEAGHRLVVDLVAREVAACVLYHHERVDGGGYPYGIDLRSLPVAVRIVQVADAYDAMTSLRPYEGPLPARVAIGELERCGGTQFDPEAVAAIRRLLVGGAIGDEPVTLEPGFVAALPADPFAGAA